MHLPFQLVLAPLNFLCQWRDNHGGVSLLWWMISCLAILQALLTSLSSVSSWIPIFLYFLVVWKQIQHNHCGCLQFQPSFCRISTIHGINIMEWKFVHTIKENKLRNEKKKTSLPPDYVLQLCFRLRNDLFFLPLVCVRKKCIFWKIENWAIAFLFFCKENYETENPECGIFRQLS